MNSRSLKTVRASAKRQPNYRLRRKFGALAAAFLLAACASDQGSAVDSVAAPGPAAAAPVVAPPNATPATPTSAPRADDSRSPANPAPPPSMVPAAAQSPSAPVAATPPTGAQTTPAAPPTQLPTEMGTPTLFWLDIGRDQAYRANADGSGAMMIASGAPLSGADGVAVDPVDGHVFILNMGGAGSNAASLVRYGLDGSNPEVLIPPGTRVGDQTFNTGKQVTMDPVNRLLYMADREGAKVWRSDLDGKNLEVLVSAHGIMQVVGVGADPTKNQFYFSDKTGHKIFRANMQMPEGKTHADRDDVELLYVDKASFASSLDIELDLEARRIYWTDKDQNIVFGMDMEMPAGADAMTRTDVESVATGLTGVIGLGFDHQEGTLYATHSGSVSSFKTDGSGLVRIGSNASTGITFVRLP